jgi:hypothetical protein
MARGATADKPFSQALVADDGGDRVPFRVLQVLELRLECGDGDGELLWEDGDSHRQPAGVVALTVSTCLPVNLPTCLPPIWSQFGQVT